MSAASRVGGAPAFLVIILLIIPFAPKKAESRDTDVFLEVHPDRIQAGHQVGLRASCGDDDFEPATVRSRAFGEVRLTPKHDSRILTGSATVPTSTQPGEYRVNLRCEKGATAHATLVVLDMARPTRGPDTGGGGTAAAEESAGGTPLLIAGAGLAALALGSLLLARRRRSG